MTNRYTEYKNRFFAAANGAEGFKSYFDDIFPSDKMEGVFILKGGPGTGKSTLLGEIAKRFQCPDIEVEIFHCSSDPASLDGVLLTRGEKSACILDGTAPHERDAILPGAVDEIVNLGAFFDEGLLRGKKEEILSLQRKKGLAYKEAYFYLGLFGIFEEKIMAETKRRIDKNAVKAWVDTFFPKRKNITDGTSFVPRPIRAFCKDGTVRLDSYEKMAERTIRIHGDPMEGGVLLSLLNQHLCAHGYGGYYAPSPLVASLTDGLFLKEEKTAVTLSCEGERCDVRAEDFFKNRDSASAEEAATYRAEGDRFLTAARNALSSASLYHFALEKIYTPAMHFDRLMPIREALFGRIASLLGLTEFS